MIKEQQRATYNNQPPWSNIYEDEKSTATHNGRHFGWKLNQMVQTNSNDSGSWSQFL
jgi:hypothetical protein